MNDPDPPPAAHARDALPESVPGGLSGRLPARATGGGPRGRDEGARRADAEPGPESAAGDAPELASGTAPQSAAGGVPGILPGAAIDTGREADEVRDDRELMGAWCGGEADAFDALYARHRAALYRYVLNGCGDEAQARELFQDVWLRVVDARERWSPDAPFHAWLYRIARNRLIDHYRRRPAHRHEPFDEETVGDVAEIAPPLGPDEIASLVERGDVLHAALACLPPAQREAILLQHVAGMRLSEIGEVVGESVETVKSRLRYGVAKLRKTLRASA